MKTLQGWRDSELNSFNSYVKPFDEIDRCLYDYFLEMLPPIYCSHGFMCSEPYDYDPNYDTYTYACFVSCNERYYFLGDISYKAVNTQYKRLCELLS